MKANRKKLELQMARACTGPSKLAELAKMPRPTLDGVIYGKSVRPETLGKVAKALGVDVTEILEG